MDKVRELLMRVSKIEMIVAAIVAVVMLALVIIEPNILEAPFENANTLLFTIGGTLLAGAALLIMLGLRVPPPARLVLLLVPFAIVNWWLLSPYFIDDVADDEFATSISAQLASPEPAAQEPASQEPAAAEAPAEEPAEQTEAPATDAESAEAPAAEPTAVPVEPTAVPTGPVLLSAGQFIGLAGHDGTGDAGLFQNPDGSFVLRFENFDIENGPDLRVYLVPGADQVSLPDGSINLGDLKGNIGDQNYELPAGTVLDQGAYTALVWCEAFSVEFVGATLEL